MFNNLEFKKSDQIFEDGSREMYSRFKGKCSREDLRVKLQEMSNQLKAAGKNANVGVALHYKKLGKWAPAIFSVAGSNVTIYDPKDSPDTEDAYKEDEIDGAEFMIINHDKELPVNKKYKRPIKEKATKVKDFF
jgi:hypothetical protein